MNINQPSVINFWKAQQVVSETDMINLTYDIYNKLAVISQNITPCILYGAQLSVSSGTLNFTSGLLRSQDLNSGYLPDTPVAGLFLIEAGSFTLPSGSGLIVAQISVTPAIAGNTLYTTTGTISALSGSSGYDANTMVILGNYSVGSVNYSERDYDFINLQSLLKNHQHTFINADNYQMLATDYNTYLSDGTGPFTNVYLPTVVSLAEKYIPIQYKVVNMNLSNSFTLSTSDSTPIMGMSNIYVPCLSSIITYYDYSYDAWVII